MWENEEGYDDSARSTKRLRMVSVPKRGTKTLPNVDKVA